MSKSALVHKDNGDWGAQAASQLIRANGRLIAPEMYFAITHELLSRWKNASNSQQRVSAEAARAFDDAVRNTLQWMNSKGTSRRPRALVMA
jgi:hypothetical protein